MLRIKEIKRFGFFAIYLVMFSLLLYSPAIAADSSHSVGNGIVQTAGSEVSHEASHTGDRSGDLLDLLYRFINFSLLVIILFIVIKKTKLADYLSARSEEIRQRLEDLRKEKREAESRYQEIEKRIKDFESKRREILDRYKKEGLAEKDKIIADAKDRIKKIIDQSELTIRQEVQSAREKLKQHLVELAAQKAEAIVVKEMDEKDQENLVNEFIERVGRVN